MSNKITNEPRICQRGVDGSESCGDPRASYDAKTGQCRHVLNPEATEYCLHACDFSPSPRAKVETHEFIAAQSGSGRCVFNVGDVGQRQWILCGQPPSAPVHKVAEESQLPAWANRNCGACGGSGYTSLGGCYMCQKRARQINQTQTNSVGPPSRVWIQIFGEGAGRMLRLHTTEIDPREVHDNGKPVYQFVHLAPIQEMLEACERGSVANDLQVIIRKSDWDALVKAVRRDTK